MSVYEDQYFFLGSLMNFRKVLEGIENLCAPAQMAQRQLTEDERMRNNEPAVEYCGELLVANAQMIDPNRRIGQDHAGFRRRRGAA